jgi:hypothetical protein
MRAMIAEYSSDHLFIVLAALGALVVLSLLTQTGQQRKSSWPTWLVLPLAMFFALALGAESKPPSGFHPAYLVASLVVIVRWGAALIIRERDSAWIYYIFILVGLALIEPASDIWNDR